MKTLTYLFTFFLTSVIIAQNNVEIEVIKTNAGYTFNAINNSGVKQKTTLTITKKNLKGTSKPVVKIIPPNSSIEMTKLYFIKGKANEYKYNLKYKPIVEVKEEIVQTTTKTKKSTKKEIIKSSSVTKSKNTLTQKQDKARGVELERKKKLEERERKLKLVANKKKLKENTTTDLTNLDKGIVVFSKDGCPRCHRTTSYLVDNDVPFRMINTTKNKNGNTKMWEMVRKEVPKGSITMPVILVDGKLSYSIKDLQGFIANLK